MRPQSPVLKPFTQKKCRVFRKMESRWSDKDAALFVEQYTQSDCNIDIALRVYTSRLLGLEEKLVLHGGGNTSVKTVVRDVLGKNIDVLCVKGSGWDLRTLEPPGLPAIRLSEIKELARLNVLSDEEMVNEQRSNLLDSTAPNPSVETLLHAFLPHKFIDHTHANAVLTLCDQAGGEELCREVYGDRMGYVPYIMPGFALAKKAVEVFDADPAVEGLILLKHGIFTFGDTARQSYERMITMTTMAEDVIEQRRRRVIGKPNIRSTSFPIAQLAPIIRGSCTIDNKKPMLLDFRTSDKIHMFLGGKDLLRYSKQGTITPDHVIRTKPNPLIFNKRREGSLETFREDFLVALQKYVVEYREYFARNNFRLDKPKIPLDPIPRVILIPEVGLFGLGATPAAARIAADLAETNIEVILDIEAIGQYEGIKETDIFDIEYWSLEQAKLAKETEKPLQRKIVVVTGGGSGIGAATARQFALAGATVVVIDVVENAAVLLAKEIGGLGIGCDVTNSNAVNNAFNRVSQQYGGLDILVSNAGAAWQGKIGEVTSETLRESFELNFFAHQTVAQAAVNIFLLQGIGGCLLFNTSKQAINPGKNFGPYGLPKAATLSLMKQYALDYGREGIRSNAINADRIRSGLLTDEMIALRSKERRLSQEDYMSGNLLGREVTADDVAKAFLDLARAEKTTGAILTVDGGNIEASLR